MSKKSGFLTDGQRQYLNGEPLYKSDQADQQTRYRIRKRTASALRDLWLVERGLPAEDDRRMIFEQLKDPELWEGMIENPQTASNYWVMPDLLSFLMLGYESTEQFGLVNHAQQWIEEAMREAYPRAFIKVHVTYLEASDIQELKEQFDEDPENVTGARTDIPKEDAYEALWDADLITKEEWREYSPVEDIRMYDLGDIPVNRVKDPDDSGE